MKRFTKTSVPGIRKNNSSNHFTVRIVVAQTFETLEEAKQGRVALAKKIEALLPKREPAKKVKIVKKAKNAKKAGPKIAKKKGAPRKPTTTTHVDAPVQQAA